VGGVSLTPAGSDRIRSNKAIHEITRNDSN
jgi:hypothetical protein